MFAGISLGAVSVEKKFFAKDDSNPAPASMQENANTSTSVAAPTASVTVASSGTASKKSNDDCEDEDGEDDDEDRSDTCGTQIVPTPAPAAVTPSKTATQPVAQASGTFTMAQVAAHNSATSCYSAISGSVYNLTSFISQHPGGSAAIKSLCGVDGTSAYMGQHGGARRPANELVSLKIGTLMP